MLTLYIPINMLTVYNAPMNDQIRTRIKEEMRAKKITQKKLGEMTGIKQPNIAHLLSGGVNVPDQWRRILEALSLHLEAVLDDPNQEANESSEPCVHPSSENKT
jgi:transcriptional regulator with XRE-family HTH domain